MMPFIAVDWGTTNRRAYRIEEGRVTASESSGPGAKAMVGGDYPGEVAGIRDRLGDLPMLLVGMVGSTIGWREVPYVAAPAAIGDIAANLAWIDERTAIVPGVAAPAARGPIPATRPWTDHPPPMGRGGGARTGPDVMRGEEVQLLGAHVAGLVPPDALLCQPGTHCKWVALAGGRIASIRTAITGELFALLKEHSILAGQLGHAVHDDAAFAEGVADAGDDLLGALFRVRASGVLGLRKDEDAASYASGLLIGTDVAARRVQDQTVYLLADPLLGALYGRAIALRGGSAVTIESSDAFIAGALAIRGLTP